MFQLKIWNQQCAESFAYFIPICSEYYRLLPIKFDLQLYIAEVEKKLHLTWH